MSEPHGKRQQWGKAAPWVAVALTFAVQTVVFGMAAGRTLQRVDDVERKQRELSDTRERVIRLETLAEESKRAIDGLNSKVDRLIDLQLRRRP